MVTAFLPVPCSSPKGEPMTINNWPTWPASSVIG